MLCVAEMNSIEYLTISSQNCNILKLADYVIGAGFVAAFDTLNINSQLTISGARFSGLFT